MAPKRKRRPPRPSGHDDGLDPRVLKAAALTPVGVRLSASVAVLTSFSPQRGDVDSAAAAANAAASTDTAALSDFGLGPLAVTSYTTGGVHSLYAWQAAVLRHNGAAALLRGGSITFMSPTSSGKTLIAEVLMLQRLRARLGVGKAILVVPFVALVLEKVKWLRSVWSGLGVTVAGFYNAVGGHSLEGIDVAVCTIERANGLINVLIAGGRLGELACLVIDELHMLGDSTRGYFIECMVTKLRLWDAPPSFRLGASAAASARAPPHRGVQLIGLSATLSNPDQLGRWMGGDSFTCSQRTVPLGLSVIAGSVEYRREGLAPLRVFGRAALASPLAASVALPVTAYAGVADERAAAAIAAAAAASPFAPEHSKQSIVARLCLESAAAGRSVLVFCDTQKACVTLASHLAKVAASAPECAALHMVRGGGVIVVLALLPISLRCCDEFVFMSHSVPPTCASPFLYIYIYMAHPSFNRATAIPGST